MTYLEISQSQTLGWVNATDDVKPLALSGVDQVECRTGRNAVHVSDPQTSLDEIVLVNGTNSSLPYKQANPSISIHFSAQYFFCLRYQCLSTKFKGILNYY